MMTIMGLKRITPVWLSSDVASRLNFDELIEILQQVSIMTSGLHCLALQVAKDYITNCTLICPVCKSVRFFLHKNRRLESIFIIRSVDRLLMLKEKKEVLCYWQDIIQRKVWSSTVGLYMSSQYTIADLNQSGNMPGLA